MKVFRLSCEDPTIALLDLSQRPWWCFLPCGRLDATLSQVPERDLAAVALASDLS